MVLLAEVAARTRRIKLAAGVVSVWGRTPATIAMSAATLHQICGGRFVLGLGASTRQLAEGFHDVPYTDPAARLRHVTLSVRALLRGERARLSAVPAARPLRLGQAPVPDLPIWIAATGEQTVRVAAELADGWFPLFLRRDPVPRPGGRARHRPCRRGRTMRADHRRGRAVHGRGPRRRRGPGRRGRLYSPVPDCDG